MQFRQIFHFVKFRTKMDLLYLLYIQCENDQNSHWVVNYKLRVLDTQTSQPIFKNDFVLQDANNFQLLNENFFYTFSSKQKKINIYGLNLRSESITQIKTNSYQNLQGDLALVLGNSIKDSFDISNQEEENFSACFLIVKNSNLYYI
jgi:hypothetical protein